MLARDRDAEAALESADSAGPQSASATARVILADTSPCHRLTYVFPGVRVPENRNRGLSGGA